MIRRLRIIIISIILTVAGIAILTVATSSDRLFLGVSVKSDVRIEKVLRGKNEEDFDISLLKFGGNPVGYDAVSHTIFLSANINKDVWDGIITSEEGQLYFLKDPMMKSRLKRQAIANGASFELYNVYESTYSKVNVVLSGMPIICIDQWWDISKEHKSGSIQIFDTTQTGNEYQSTVCDYYVRGNLARTYEKKGYKVKLSDKKLSLCGLRKDDDWILNALYDDTGFVRNMISYRLWNEMAALNDVPGDETVECAYVELILDNEYMGMYLLCERLDAKKLGLSKRDRLYKQRVRPERYNEEGYKNAFEVTHPGKYDDDDVRFMTDFMARIFEPEKNESTYEELSSGFYMDNIVDYTLFCLMLAAGDNLFNNSFFAAIAQDDGSYIMKEIPWDLNGTFGCAGGHLGYEDYRIHEISEMYPLLGQTLRNCDSDAFYAICAERWKELRGSAFSEENITELAEEYIKYTENTGAYKRDLERWPQREVKEEVRDYTELWKKEELFSFIRQRLTVLDEYFETDMSDTEKY